MMRKFTGVILTIIFIVTFILFFTLTSEEFSNAKTIDEVLDESIQFTNIDISENSIMLDRDGNNISDIYSAENCIYLDYEDIPMLVINAFISAEDQSFFEHQGFDAKGMTRALFVNLQNQSLDQGASTITQQLVRNFYLTSEKTYERKLAEILYAYKLEQELTKEKILELYVNTVFFHNGVYGIEAASKFYFNKPSHELSVAEVAFLTAIPNNPELYNPLKNIENTHERKEWMLAKMRETDSIDEEQYEESLAAEIVFNVREKIDLYPDYVTYVFHEFEQLVSKQDGYEAKIHSANSDEEIEAWREELSQRVDSLLKQGITIETHLDRQVQDTAQASIHSYLNGSQLQAATAIIDHQTNELVAITGGLNYKKFDFHRGFQAHRQPGSSIKPLLVFAPYLELMGVTENHIVDAGPFSKNGYEPKNYGGAVYGKVPMQEALKKSYNTAAVRLFDFVGPQLVYENYMDKFDFTRLVADDRVLPAALGGLTYGVSALEITQAFTSFMTDGVYYSPRAIKQVTDKDGNLLYAWPDEGQRVWKENTVVEMRKMLARVVSEGTGRAASFHSNGYLGGKTGTTNTYHDLWFVGSTDRYTSGIWLGYDTPKSIGQGVNTHMHIWRSYMSQLD